MSGGGDLSHISWRITLWPAARQRPADQRVHQPYDVLNFPMALTKLTKLTKLRGGADE